MSKYLTFTTLIEPEYSVYLPTAKHGPKAFHQDVQGNVWSEWSNSGHHNNAYLRTAISALEVARVQESMRKLSEVAA